MEQIEKKFVDADAQNKKLKQLALKTRKESDQLKKKLANETEEKKKISAELKVRFLFLRQFKIINEDTHFKKYFFRNGSVKS